MTDAGKMPVAERVTVSLLHDASAAMARIRLRTGLTKTDIINRALVLYDFIDDETRKGKQMLLRDEEGYQELVRIVS